MEDATNAREHVTDWLRDAHAMEQQSEAMLKTMAERSEFNPDLNARAIAHLAETRWQRDQLELCLKRLGASPSTLKDITGKLMAFGESAVAMMASDEAVKGAMASYVFEHMEIASYTVLIRAAEAVGDQQTKLVCEQILQQEVAMADWMLQHLPAATSQFLYRSTKPA